MGDVGDGPAPEPEPAPVAPTVAPWPQASAVPPPPPAPPPPPPHPPSYPQGYPPPNAAPYAPARGTNGFAIASFVCSLVACGIGSVLAIIFGHIARGQIRRNDEGGNGLALAGLILGYLGVVVMATFIVTAVVLSTSARDDFARDDARQFGRDVVAYARLVGTTPRDASAVGQAIRSDCCLADVTIGNTGLSARGATTEALAAAGWQLEFEYFGDSSFGRACLTLPDSVDREPIVFDGGCTRPSTAVPPGTGA